LAREKLIPIPLNFLAPIPGTPLAGRSIMDRRRFSGKSMFRMMEPAAEIKVCAGRRTCATGVDDLSGGRRAG